jgi:hypothetical protein
MDTHTTKTIAHIGTYKPEDVTFLLKKVVLESTDVETKEKAIQSGTKHYSEMISMEKAPTPEYMHLFEEAMASGAKRFGLETAKLAHGIAASVEGSITLVSLVRAGVPLGVVLKRAIETLGRDVEHYGVSIIRDRGIDHEAMKYILGRRPASGIVFVDGWTGKGAIIGQLEKSCADYDGLEPRLAVLADPCGRTWLAASGDDWLIPSGILGATVSGLFSRSILNDDVVGTGDFHACVQWDHMSEFDISQEFVERVWTHTLDALDVVIPAVWSDDEKARLQETAYEAVDWVVRENGVANLNRVKPGIAEATRAILRRMPDHVYVSDPNDPELAALMHLIKDRGVPYTVSPNEISPYRAITLIKKVT